MRWNIDLRNMDEGALVGLIRQLRDELTSTLEDHERRLASECPGEEGEGRHEWLKAEAEYLEQRLDDLFDEALTECGLRDRGGKEQEPILQRFDSGPDGPAVPGGSHPAGDVGVPRRLRGDLRSELWGLVNELRDRLRAGAITERVTIEALDERTCQMDLDEEDGADEQTFLGHRKWLRDALRQSLRLDSDEEWDDDIKMGLTKLLRSMAPIPLEDEDAARYVEEHVTAIRQDLKQMFLSLLGHHPFERAPAEGYQGGVGLQASDPEGA